MGVYEQKRASAYKSIKAKGAAMVLRRSVGGEYDPSTLKTAPATVMEYPCYGLIEEYSSRDEGEGATAGTLIMAGDKKITLTAADGFPDPATADTLTFGGKVFNVIRCKPLAPGGVAILYEVQARK